MWKPGCSFEMQRLRHREGKGLSEEDTGIRGKSKSEPRCPYHQASPFPLPFMKPSQVLMAMPFTRGAASCPVLSPCWLCLVHLPTDGSEPLWEPATLQGPPDPQHPGTGVLPTRAPLWLCAVFPPELVKPARMWSYTMHPFPQILLLKRPFSLSHSYEYLET